jgi:peptidase E
VRRILAVGGGTLNSVDRDRRLLRYVLRLTGRPTPTLCMLPTASGDSTEQIVTWYEITHGLDCRPRHVRLFGAPGRVKSFERPLLEADAIFVSGGNTLNMLAVWRDQGIDKTLRKAWEKGTVLAGESAGMNCWFTRSVTDSRAQGLTGMDGLGWLPGSVCPHYNNPARRPAYHELLLGGTMPDGIACDDGAAVLFEGTTLAKAVAISETAKNRRVAVRDGRVVEDDIPTELLPDPA